MALANQSVGTVQTCGARHRVGARHDHRRKTDGYSACPQHHGQEKLLSLALLILGGLSLIGIMVSIWMIFFYTPVDALQGEPQRILYIHVPTAWGGMLGFIILAVVGMIYLFRPHEPLDWIARASAEVSAVYLSITLLLGMLWGKPIWGAWWVWDPKLTASLILWFMYIGYIMIRSSMGRTRDSARVGAVIGIVGVIDVPIIYLSVQWWRGQHPTAEIGVQGALPAEATLTFLVTTLTFTLLYCFLLIMIYQLQKLQTRAEQLRAIVS
jgi:heme exporter protein C